MAELEIKNVVKEYSLGKMKFRALEDINLSFEKGELVSIMGESGSGKSTLMNLIGGLDSDYQGDILIDGKNLKDFKDKQLDDYRKKKIGFVFQSFNLIPHLSILDNVTIALTLSNVKESVKNEKAIEILTKLGLKEQIKKKPTQLSGGQKQRVAIARALINDPDIILADEPTGALDSQTTTQILNLLKEIADDEGKLVIMVTHSEKVASISSRVVEISDGKIVRDEKAENYQKRTTKRQLIIHKEDQEVAQEKPKKEKHLSFLSALKLSIHNMWASKVKNILMAIGVSISLIALIIMLSFGSGLTGYINSLAQSYSDPTIATISKSGLDRDGNEIEDQGGMSFMPDMFEESEISEIVTELNTYLQQNDSEFRVITEGEDKNLSYGYFMITMTAGSILYTKADGSSASSQIMATYTTPPYYDENQLITDNSKISGEDEIMLSRAIVSAMGYENPEDVVGKTVKLQINFSYNDTLINIDKDVTISGLVDVSVFSGMTVMYIDYDYLDKCVIEAQNTENPTGLKPSQLYIQTDSEQTTDLINKYISQNRKDLTGSVEEQLASMFSEMMSTFSVALAIIGGISLIVALIMILVVLYMSVSERTREIGVLKSIGARKKDIKLIFSTESLLIGIISAISGILLSLIIIGVLTLIFNSLLGFAPIAVEWQYLLIAFAISVVISVLAGLYPASKAAKLDPVESLRHE